VSRAVELTFETDVLVMVYDALFLSLAEERIRLWSLPTVLKALQGTPYAPSRTPPADVGSLILSTG
jgi:hypothetical protein